MLLLTKLLAAMAMAFILMMPESDGLGYDDAMKIINHHPRARIAMATDTLRSHRNLKYSKFAELPEYRPKDPKSAIVWGGLGMRSYDKTRLKVYWDSSSMSDEEKNVGKSDGFIKFHRVKRQAGIPPVCCTKDPCDPCATTPCIACPLC